MTMEEDYVPDEVLIEAGIDAEEKPLLAMFKPDDPEEFILWGEKIWIKWYYQKAIFLNLLMS